jgi:hypothetical protein
VPGDVLRCECERRGDVTVERIEPNEAAIGAELLEMLAMRLCVTAKDVETGKVDTAADEVICRSPVGRFDALTCA